ncbi:MAG: hypothetical protein IIB77_09315 [Proteobacteria bacterium]|nr:hypothetical protein [Pseudomonadota bacterium]
MTFSIRDATPADAATIAEFSKDRYWVAVAGDEIIAQIAVTCEWSDWLKKPAKNRA